MTHYATLSKGLIALFFLTASMAQGQNFVFRQFIMVTDTVEDDGIIFAASTDDAEQENDEMDALFDDDLDAGWEGAPEDQNRLTTGLRFRNIGVPKGAVIDSAFLILYAHEGKSADDVARITLVSEATDHSLTFTEDALITDRPRTATSVLWEVAEEWELWQPYRTPDIKGLIQEVINRNGWLAGNALSIFMMGENQGVTDVENAREFESFENISDPEDGGDGQNHPERRPELVIYFSGANLKIETPIMFTDTIEDDGIVFEASSDDAEQQNDEMDSLFDDDLDAGWEGAPEDQNMLTTGLRFRNLGIPKGAVIDSAFIQVWSHEGKSAEDVARITITGEASDNAQTFTEDALITDRPRTSASILWEVAEEWTLWGQYQTPDLKNIIQEIVDRTGWNAGQSMAFILQGENQGVTDVENAREFESYENISDPEDGGDGQNHPERRPRLVVYYSSGTSSVKDLFHSHAMNLTIYPNPVREGRTTVLLNSDAAAQVTLVNAEGNLVKSQITSGGRQFNLQTSQLPSGIYFLQVIQDGQLFVERLIIH